jgi:hypothetical protein
VVKKEKVADLRRRLDEETRLEEERRRALGDGTRGEIASITTGGDR